MTQARRPSPGKPRAKSPAATPRVPPDLRLGTFFLWLLLVVPPFVVARVAKESFRQPKLLASEWLVLASLVAFAWGLRRVGEVRFADLWRMPAVRIALPILAVATAGLAVTRHPIQTREGLIDLWIGAAALVGWSAALSASQLQRLLRGILWPATALAVLGISQFHGIWQPLDFFGLTPGSRLAITSLAGNPGDLGAYLVLPVLIAQGWLCHRLRHGEGWRGPVWGTVGALVVCLYALLLTQTLAALAAVVAGSLLFWGAQLPRRRMIFALTGGAALAVLLMLGVPPLRERMVEKGRQALRGDFNAVLTGRLDGWRSAVWMLRQHPLTGIGHGAYRVEFVPAKLALLDRGVPFYPLETQYVFANAHNEVQEVAAEWGVPGLLALGWALLVLIGALRRAATSPLGGEERGAVAGALAWAGTVSLGLLSLAHFPFRLALVGFPALLFLSWICRRSQEAP